MKMKVRLIGKNGKMGRVLSEMIAKDAALQEVETGEDLVIDFSSPEGTQKAIALQKPLVCGTTGLPEPVMQGLKTLSKSQPVLYAPNFSLGMMFLYQIVETMGGKLKAFSSPKIQETHHIHKKDKPSGSALKIAQILDIDPKNIESTRSEEVVGEHTIKFDFGNEVLTLSHQVLSRTAFALGALKAAQFILHKPPRLYSVYDLLD